MEYPELTQPGPALAAVPDEYRRAFPHNDLVRIRRGPISATLLTRGGSRFFTLRSGQAVINGVRFASAFFGKGQFVPSTTEDRENGWGLSQSLVGPYFQPLDPPRIVTADDWGKTRPLRKQTEICRLEQLADVTETARGFRLRVQAHGTDGVPLAIEINFREGGKLEGVVPAPKVDQGWLLPSGQATCRFGGDVIRFGPGLQAHSYTQIRAAEPKLPGPSVYLTGFTPFDHSIEFDCG